MTSASRSATADHGSRRRAVDLLTAALLLTVLTRLVFILLPRVPIETKAVASIGDSREYIALARNLVSSHTFTRDTVPPFRPELFRTPGYPLLLAIPFLLTPPSSLLSSAHPSSFILLSLLLQLLLSLVTVWLTWRLAVELELGPVTSALAALLVGLSPSLAFLSTKLISETLFLPMLLACMLLLNRYRLSGRALDLIGTGVCCGLLVLVRPIAIFFPFLIALYILWLGTGKTGTVPRQAGAGDTSATRSSRRSGDVSPSRSSPVFPGLGSCLLFLVCASIVVAPWVIRNGTRTGRYIISTASEHNIYLYDAATVLAAEKGITIPQARDLMMAEAETKFGRIGTNDEATMWQKLAAVARPHFFRRPALAIPVWLFGVAADFLNPISVGPLLIHSGASPAAGSANLLQSSLALLVKGKVTQAFTRAWQVRVGGAPLFILVVLACATLFNLILIWFGFASLFLRRSRGLFWLLLPILYFTLLTGTVGDARFRAPIEPFLCLFAAVALTRPPRSAAARPYEAQSDGIPDQDTGSCSIGLAAPESRGSA